MTNSVWSVPALKSRGSGGGGVESKKRARHSVLRVSSGKEFSLLAPLPKAGVLGPYCSASASRSPGCPPSPSWTVLASHHPLQAGCGLHLADSHEAFFGLLSSPGCSCLHPMGKPVPCLFLCLLLSLFIILWEGAGSLRGLALASVLWAVTLEGDVPVASPH